MMHKLRNNLGGPNLNSIALPAGNPSYLDVIAELSGVTVPVKIVLEIFSTSVTSYTDSAESYGVCYKVGSKLRSLATCVKQT